MGLFALAGDDACLCQLHHTACEHFGVDAKVFLVHKACCNCVGDSANAKLDAVAVVDHACNDFADCKVLFIGLCVCKFRHRIIHFHNVVHVVKVKLHVTKSSRCVGIDFKDDCLCCLDHLHFVGV